MKKGYAGVVLMVVLCAACSGDDDDGITPRSIQAQCTDVMQSICERFIECDENVIVEKGNMVQSDKDKTRWTYVASQNANTNHVKVIVDAADLAAQVREEAAEKNL